jgi:hypothetical protein
MTTYLQQNLDELRREIEAVRPEACCAKTTMREVGKGESVVCTEDCKWQEIDRLLAVVMIDVEILVRATKT